ncbi:hypothetical protein QFZ77_002541 [Paenibacillus sp. V4I3]|uniref:hypothetical protein n=1 Tax=Paenibacillus sp. V4I3 TaxID=3042305 RepID=UPI00277D4E9F|nr:hypothetical protein [Paenibacillus sp. V4I3]MDQ0873882.1 hypothetical protein [Paenibacillus sp. V4I3]
MKRFQLLLIIFVTLFLGCKADTEETFSFSSILSNNEGKYYITVLGATEELKREFEQVFQRNINVIDGYYENGNPSNRELQALKVESLPTYFVFDTEKEVFITDDIFKLSKFLMERTNNTNRLN